MMHLFQLYRNLTKKASLQRHYAKTEARSRSVPDAHSRAIL